jgi:hypothetical protein
VYHAPVDAQTEEQVAQLVLLGLDRRDALLALEQSGGGGVASAADWFFTHREAGAARAERARPADDVTRLIDL